MPLCKSVKTIKLFKGSKQIFLRGNLSSLSFKEKLKFIFCNVFHFLKKIYLSQAQYRLRDKFVVTWRAISSDTGDKIHLKLQ